MPAIAAKSAPDRVLVSRNHGFPMPWITPRRADVCFLRALLNKKTESPCTLSQRRLADAYATLQASESVDAETVLKAQLIVYVSPSMAGATGLFERINLRGKDVSQFDLVKNKLIEWSAVESAPAAREHISSYITNRYDTLYQRLDPSAGSAPYDSDKLLRNHWILFTDTSFGSSDHVLDKLNTTLHEVLARDGSVLKWIEAYLDSLVEVTEAWIAVERPFDVPSRYGRQVRQALLNFARLEREGEQQPLIIAALIRWGDDAAKLIRYCEIDSFRAALAKKNSNSGRSAKWRFARALYQGKWKDAKDKPITDSRAAVHQLFWASTPYWNRDEAALFEPGQSREQLRRISFRAAPSILRISTMATAASSITCSGTMAPTCPPRTNGRVRRKWTSAPSRKAYGSRTRKASSPGISNISIHKMRRISVRATASPTPKKWLHGCITSGT